MLPHCTIFHAISSMKECCQTLEDLPDLTMRNYLRKAQFAVFLL